MKKSVSKAQILKVSSMYVMAFALSVACAPQSRYTVPKRGAVTAPGADKTTGTGTGSQPQQGVGGGAVDKSPAIADGQIVSLKLAEISMSEDAVTVRLNTDSTSEMVFEGAGIKSNKKVALKFKSTTQGSVLEQTVDGAKSVGELVIADDGSMKATISVTYKKDATKVTKINLEKSSNNMKLSKSAELVDGTNQSDALNDLSKELDTTKISMDLTSVSLNDKKVLLVPKFFVNAKSGMITMSARSTDVSGTDLIIDNTAAIAQQAKAEVKVQEKATTDSKQQQALSVKSMKASVKSATRLSLVNSADASTFATLGALKLKAAAYTLNEDGSAASIKLNLVEGEKDSKFLLLSLVKNTDAPAVEVVETKEEVKEVAPAVEKVEKKEKKDKEEAQPVAAPAPAPAPAPEKKVAEKKTVEGSAVVPQKATVTTTPKAEQKIDQKITAQASVEKNSDLRETAMAAGKFAATAVAPVTVATVQVAQAVASSNVVQKSVKYVKEDLADDHKAGRAIIAESAKKLGSQVASAAAKAVDNTKKAASAVVDYTVVRPAKVADALYHKVAGDETK